MHLYCDQWQNAQCSFKYFEQCMFDAVIINYSRKAQFSKMKVKCYSINLLFLSKHCLVLNFPMVCDQSSSVVVCACLGLIHP